jgi:hypothetical protein
MGLFIRHFCALILGLACFAPVFLSNRQFAFRDSGDFYYPLYLRVQQEWRAGRLPSWEPEENGGVPLLGNPTAAVLYPGKLIYAVLPYPWAARTYVIVHVGLAYTAMWILMRGWGVSPSGRALAALGYAFGGPVLLQYCNVIFLVGAAWMPLAFLAIDRWIRAGRTQSLIWLAVVLAMQILGGDAEAAYLAMLAAIGYAAGLFVTARPRRTRSLIFLTVGLSVAYAGLLAWSLWAEPLGRISRVWWRPPAPRLALLCWIAIGGAVLARWWRVRTWRAESRLLGLAGSAALAIALAGIQLVPSLEFIGQSPRGGATTAPATIYDLSIHPARVLEGIWPGFFGTITQGNRRWVQALPPTYDHLVWMESIYLGGFTLCLGLAAAGVRRVASCRGWLTAVAIAGLAGGLGSYGSPLFWARSIPALQPLVGSHVSSSEGWPDPSAIPDGVGSPYWFLTVAMPGFGAFRYPGKLLVIASLAICGLAGLGWDDLRGGASRRTSWIAVAALVTSLLGAFCLALPLSRAAFVNFLQARPDMTTTVFGPLETAGAIGDAWRALAQGGVVAALLLILARSRHHTTAGYLAVAVSALDLGLAHGPLIYTVPQGTFDDKPKAVAVIEKAEAKDPAPGPFRIHRQANWAPGAWLARGSPGRLEDIARWERSNLRPKYAITELLAYAFTRGTAELSDLIPFFDTMRIQLDPETCRRHGFPEGYQVVYFTRRGFDLWNARYFILPARIAFGSRFRGVLSFLPRTTEIDPPPGSFDGPEGEARRQRWLLEDDVQVLRNEAAFPRAWIVHRARFPIPISSPTDLRRLMDEILYQDDELWHVEDRRVFDPRAVAWLEVSDEERKSIAAALSGSQPDASETVKIEGYRSDRVELSAQLTSPGIIILADVFYPGWELTIDGTPAHILRANRAMRGALVPAGIHRLVYTYRPASLRLGVMISMVGALLWLALLWRSRGSTRVSGLLQVKGG